MALTDFTIIRRSMTSRMFSTVTTIITVAVAVGLMLVLLSMRDAGRRAFERGSGNMHLFISRDASPLTGVLNGIFYASAPRRPIEWAKYNEIRKAFPLEFAVPIQLGDSYEGEYRVLATTPEFFSKFQPDPDVAWILADGRYFTGDFEVVLGAAAARGTGLKAGDRIVLTHGISKSREASAGLAEPHDDHHHGDHDHEHEAGDPIVHGGSADGGAHVHHDFIYTVVGILKPTGAAHDRAMFTSLNSSWIVHANERREQAGHGHIEKTTVDDLVDADRLITGIYARVMTRPGSDQSAAIQQIFDQLRRDPSITIASPTQEIDRLFTIVSNIDQLFLAMAAVVMISSGIAIMLALYNSMEQRRRQIAVLRVLGCSQRRIFGLVLTESAMIGLFGAMVGFGLCMAGGFVVAAVMKQRLGLVIQPSFDPAWTLVVLLATVGLASVAGLVPAAMAYRTSVATNLKPIG